MFTLLRQRRLRWLGHVHRMEDGRIPKDLLYGELESGSRPVGRPKLRFKDVCKRDMLNTGLPTGNWETHAADRGEWRSLCSRALQVGEKRLKAKADERRAKRKAVAKKQHQHQQHLTISVVDVAASAVLESDSYVMKGNVGRKCAKSWTWPDDCLLLSLIRAPL